MKTKNKIIIGSAVVVAGYLLWMRNKKKSNVVVANAPATNVPSVNNSPLANVNPSNNIPTQTVYTPAIPKDVPSISTTVDSELFNPPVYYKSYEEAREAELEKIRLAEEAKSPTSSYQDPFSGTWVGEGYSPYFN
jgi:hypothetical protein